MLRTSVIGAALLVAISSAWLTPFPGSFPGAAERPETFRLDRAPLALDRRIRALLEPAIDRDLFSGVLLVERGNEIVYQEAFGNANWELRVSNTPSNRFGVASVTKAFTETVVEVLVREGRLDLDAPVERYIAGFPAGPDGAVPTIAHLYHHRSGVPHRVTGAAEEAIPLSASDIVDRVKEQGLLFDPGSQRLYSSAGFTVLARVIEIVEEKPFEQVLEERIFAPAGMTSATSETGRELMIGRAYPYHLGAREERVSVVNAPYKDLRFLTGAGSVYATAEDLFRFLRALRKGAFGPGLWDQAVDADAASWRGWTGRTNGYNAYMDVLPSEDLIFILVSNLQSAVNWQLRDRVHDLLIGEEVAPIELPPPVVEPFEPAAGLVGAYDNNGSIIEITLVKGRLFRGDNEFYPIAGGRYYIPASGSVMAFRGAGSGRADALVLFQEETEAVLPRIR